MMPLRGTTLLAGTYTTSYGYGADGSIGYQDDPAEGGLPNELIETSYDSLGNPAAYGTSATYYVSGVVYNHLNQVAQISQINTAAVYTTPTYDPGTNRLTELLVQRAATSNAVVADDHYSYTDSGLITKDSNVTADPTAGTDTQCFGYDQLQNLAQAWTPASSDCSTAPTSSTSFGGPASYWAGYGIDPRTGNRLSTSSHTIDSSGAVTASNTATYRYPATGASPGSSGTGSGGPNAVAAISNSDGAPTQSYGYDMDGATTALPGHTITYTSQELPGAQTIAGSTETDIYDASGNLLVASDPTDGTTAYLGDTQLHAAAGSTAVSASRTYAFTGAPVAERDTQPGATTSTLVYLAGNPQGTATATITDTAAASVTRRYYDPYGNPRGPSTAWPTSTAPSTGNHGYLNAPTDPLTTSSSTDPITQLGARQYDPTLGRFLSVDPILDPADPQSLNGYAYAGNDPVNSSDPTGLMPLNPENTGGGNVPYCDWHICTSSQKKIIHENSADTTGYSPGYGGGGNASGGAGYEPTRPNPVRSACQSDAQCSNTKTGRTAYFLPPGWNGHLASNFHEYCAYTNAPCQAVLDGTPPLTPAIDRLIPTETGVCGLDTAACNSSINDEPTHPCHGLAGQTFCLAILAMLTAGTGDLEAGGTMLEEETAETAENAGGAALDTTPAGRLYSAHYLNDMGAVRNIPGSVVDETIDYGQVAKDLPDRTVFYDPKNDVAVVESKTTGKVMSVTRGAP